MHKLKIIIADHPYEKRIRQLSKRLPVLKYKTNDCIDSVSVSVSATNKTKCKQKNCVCVYACPLEICQSIIDVFNSTAQCYCQKTKIICSLKFNDENNGYSRKRRTFIRFLWTGFLDMILIAPQKYPKQKLDITTTKHTNRSMFKLI